VRTEEIQGYKIDLDTEQASGVWEVEVSVWPKHEGGPALTDGTKLTGYPSQSEAEKAGLEWAKDRIDLYTQGGPRGR
jgi:hypothetical protein